VRRYLQRLFPNQCVRVEYFGRDGEPEEIYECGRLISKSKAA
jgi:hypothetical protein